MIARVRVQSEDSSQVGSRRESRTFHSWSGHVVTIWHQSFVLLRASKSYESFLSFFLYSLKKKKNFWLTKFEQPIFVQVKNYYCHGPNKSRTSFGSGVLYRKAESHTRVSARRVYAVEGLTQNTFTLYDHKHHSPETPFPIAVLLFPSSSLNRSRSILLITRPNCQ